MLPLLKSADPMLRAHAARVLAGVKGEAVETALAGLLDDPEAAVRLWALSALAAIRLILARIPCERDAGPGPRGALRSSTPHRC